MDRQRRDSRGTYAKKAAQKEAKRRARAEGGDLPPGEAQCEYQYYEFQAIDQPLTEKYLGHPDRVLGCERGGRGTGEARGDPLTNLRAATSLARLWQRQGKRDDARARLAPLYA